MGLAGTKPCTPTRSNGSVFLNSVFAAILYSTTPVSSKNRLHLSQRLEPFGTNRGQILEGNPHVRIVCGHCIHLRIVCGHRIPPCAFASTTFYGCSSVPDGHGCCPGSGKTKSQQGRGLVSPPIVL